MLLKNFQISSAPLLLTSALLGAVCHISAAMALSPPQTFVQEIPFSFPKLPEEFKGIAQITDCGIWQSPKNTELAAIKWDRFYCSLSDQEGKKSVLWIQELNPKGLFVVEKIPTLSLLPPSLANSQFSDIASNNQLLMISAEQYVPYGIQDKGGKEWSVNWSADQQRTGLEFVLQAAYVPMGEVIVDGSFASIDDIVALGYQGQLIRFNPSQDQPQWKLTLSYAAAEQQMRELVHSDADLENAHLIRAQTPSMIINSGSDILVRKTTWQIKSGEDKGSDGTGVWCVSKDGKLKGQHFFENEFFDSPAITALPQGGYVIFDRIYLNKSVTRDNYYFQLITLDQNCQVTKQDKGSLPPAYLKNAQDGRIEDMHLQLTPASDLLLLYTEHQANDEMTPPQLNAALISKEAKVKWVQPVVRQNDSYAWYLVGWSENANIHLKIDVSFVPEGQRALISIFNPAPLRAESMNWLKPLQARDRGVDNLLPKIYQLNWAK